ncbi:MAG: efflux RND transporter periplasmic adaptor subunit, partial [Proteobacteria bacterium]|nr:efflux RND transporter periplasmic adaptor subunit [Pseudomonadota bacterium]
MTGIPVRENGRRWGWFALLVVLALAGWGIFTRLQTRSALAREARAAAVPMVSVVMPQADAASGTLQLPANVQAWADAPIYARASGYLRRWLVDIGAHVKRGQLLAQIDAPEGGQQIAQARAQLATSQAGERLAQSTAARWSSMLASDAVARQDVDEKLADAEAKRADLAAARANLDRLRQLGDYQRIVAPFDGVITARSTDVGALVTAGSGASVGRELFHIQDVSRLRIYVNVPQAFTPAIQLGAKAALRITELPGQAFPARVVSMAGALDAASRTLLTQLEVDNSSARIRPGSYGEVEFDLTGARTGLRLPAICLLFRSEGLSVATVDAQGRVTLKSVVLGRDFGKEGEVMQGVAPT